MLVQTHPHPEPSLPGLISCTRGTMKPELGSEIASSDEPGSGSSDGVEPGSDAGGERSQGHRSAVERAHCALRQNQDQRSVAERILDSDVERAIDNLVESQVLLNLVLRSKFDANICRARRHIMNALAELRG